MKKRILSCLMALALCLTLLPTAALAEETEGTAQTPPAVEEAADPANGEAKRENQPAEQEEQQEDPAAKQAVADVQAMIDALPDAEALDGMDDEDAMAVYEAFQTACDAYYETLTEEQQAQLKNTEKLEALSERFQSAALAVETHAHFLCGGTKCNGEGHEREEGGMTTFEPWPGIVNVITGHAYYLTEDLNSFTVPDGVDLTLCLNGYDISSSYDGPTIKVEPGATFTLCDCKGSSSLGGCITHSIRDSKRGVGVLVGEKTSAKNSAVFNMYGGTISYNTAVQGDEFDGGGVTVDGGTFNLYSGTISDNEALSGNKVGGGVFIGNQGTFNMSGGTITNNKAYRGGGVCVGGSYQSSDTTWFCGTFNMSGGSITNNISGGVYVNSNSDTTFKVSGTAEITGNTASDNLTQNVYLSADTKNGQTRYATPIVVEETLTGNIGVTTEKEGQTVATDVSAAAAKCFTSDSSKYRLKYDSSESTLTMISAAHSAHPICGDVNCNEHAALTDWQGVSSLPMSKGNYYLTKDVEINGTWQAPNGVNLCLNG